MGDEIGDDSEIPQLVEAATSDMLFQPDWEANLIVIDSVINFEDGPERAVEAVLQRMRSSNEMVVCLAFDLLDSLLKNVYEVIHVVGKREVIDEIMKIAQGKQRKAADKALDFIQYYADAFKMIPLLYYGYAFNQLAQKGMRFPPPREEEFVMPKKRVSKWVSQQEDAALAASLAASEAEAARQEASVSRSSKKLRRKLEAADENVKLIKEMIAGLGPQDRPQEMELFQELIPKAKQIQSELVKLIEGQGGDVDESLLEQLLSINDALSETLALYDKAVQATFGGSNLDERAKRKLMHDPRFAPLPAPNRTANAKPASPPAAKPAPAPVAAPPPPASKKPADLVDDFFFGIRERGVESQASSSPASAAAQSRSPQVAPSAPPADPFDEFAILATRKRPDSGTFASQPAPASTQSPAALVNPFDLLGSTQSQPQPQPQAANPLAPTPVMSPNPFLDIRQAPQPANNTNANQPAGSGQSGPVVGDLIQW